EDPARGARDRGGGAADPLRGQRREHRLRDAVPGAGKKGDEMTIRIGYANIYVSDLGRAVDFYHDVLGLPLLFRADQFSYARLDAGAIDLGLAGTCRPGARLAL